MTGRDVGKKLSRQTTRIGECTNPNRRSIRDRLTSVQPESVKAPKDLMRSPDIVLLPAQEELRLRIIIVSVPLPPVDDECQQ